MTDIEFEKFRQSEDRKLEREIGIRQMIHQLGDDPHREGLRDTPARVIKAWEEMGSGYKKDPKELLTTFNGEGYNEMISCGPISFYSTCEHHLLPFFGEAWVAYIPGGDHAEAPGGPNQGKIIGLSKMPRLVEIFARRLQNQERLTQQIADKLCELLSPKGAAVLITAQHFCMMARGVRQQTAKMTTSALRGAFFNNPQTRAEFLALTQR